MGGESRLVWLNCEAKNMTTRLCWLEPSFDSVVIKGPIPRSKNYYEVPIKIEILVYCQSNKKLCASPHNLSLLIEKATCNDPSFKSHNLIINNDGSFSIKNDNELFSIDEEE